MHIYNSKQPEPTYFRAAKSRFQEQRQTISSLFHWIRGGINSSRLSITWICSSPFQSMQKGQVHVLAHSLIVIFAALQKRFFHHVCRSFFSFPFLEMTQQLCWACLVNETRWNNKNFHLLSSVLSLCYSFSFFFSTNILHLFNFFKTFNVSFLFLTKK